MNGRRMTERRIGVNCCRVCNVEMRGRVYGLMIRVAPCTEGFNVRLSACSNVEIEKEVLECSCFVAVKEPSNPTRFLGGNWQRSSLSMVWYRLQIQYRSAVLCVGTVWL